MFFRLNSRKSRLGVSLALAICVFLCVPETQAFQIRGANALKVMQSGNPGESASYTVASSLRTEPGEVIFSGVHVASQPEKGGPKKNYLVTVCDLETDECMDRFPSGDDEAYTVYESCVSTGSRDPFECSEEWAMDKGLLLYGEYLVLKEQEESEKESLIFDLKKGLEFETEDTEEDFLASAPPEPTEETQAEKNTLIFDLTEGATDTEAVEIETIATGKFVVDLTTGESNVVEVPEDTHAAAPTAGEEVLAPREPDSVVEREYLSCVKVPQFVAYNDLWKWLAYRLFFVLIMFVLIIFLLGFWVFLLWKQSQETDNQRTSKNRQHWRKWFGVFLISFGFLTSEGLAQTTTPQLLIYEGELLDNAGFPLGGAYTFRFSFWANADFENTDVVAGVINGAAIDYYGWEEVQAQTLDAAGRFSFQVGTITPFVAGMFDQDNLFLQVEVKLTADPDTAYEVIDVDAADFLVDRKVISSVPFAFNANKLDYRDAGFGAGEIPYLDGAGLLPGSIIPGGIDGNVFKLDQDGDALVTDSLTLQFGDTIAESLVWNGLTSRFEFSDDLDVAGNLTVSGTINGVTIGPQNISSVLSPRYPNSIFEADGTANSGSMYEEVETVSGGIEKHILRWESEVLGVQQDYDTLVRYTLPQNFSSWQTPAISLDYIAPSGVGDAHVDFRAYKGGSATDELSGTGLDLTGAAWANGMFNLNAVTVWNPGDTIWLELRMHSRDANEARVGDIGLNYVVE